MYGNSALSFNDSDALQAVTCVTKVKMRIIAEEAFDFLPLEEPDLASIWQKQSGLPLTCVYTVQSQVKQR